MLSNESCQPNMTIGSTSPCTGRADDLWFNTVDHVWYQLYGGAWVTTYSLYPTVDPVVAGAPWNDAGTVKISTG